MSFTVRVVRHWHRLPEVWLMLHPWRLSRSGWIGPGEPDLAVVSLFIAEGLD